MGPRLRNCAIAMQIALIFISPFSMTQSAAKIVFQWRPIFKSIPNDRVPASVQGGGRILLVDLNHDSLPDFVEFGSSSNSAFIRLANANGTFENPFRIEFNQPATEKIALITAANITGQKNMVLLVGFESGKILTCSVSSSTSSCKLLDIGKSKPSPISDMMSADLDQNGSLDIVTSGPVARVYWDIDKEKCDVTDLEILGTSTAVSLIPRTEDQPPSIVLGTKPLTVLQNKGRRRFSKAEHFGPENIVPVGFRLGDFNRDKRLDLLVLDKNARNRVFLNSSKPEKTFDTGQPLFHYRDGSPNEAIVVDLNLDSIPDLIVGTNDGAQFYISQGDGSFTEGLDIEGIEASEIKGIGVGPDPDGVGERDLFVSTNSGMIKHLSISLMR